MARTKKIIYRKRKSRRFKIQKGGNEKIYIKNAHGAETEYVYPILKNIYINKDIIFVDKTDDNKYDLIFKSVFNNDFDKNEPYIFLSGEAYKNIPQYNINDPNCIAKLITSEDPETTKMKNTFYLPFFLNVGPYKLDNSPFIREYQNNPRDKLALYIARNIKEHRENMFKSLINLDKTVEALGKASKTNNVDLPDKWWDLPEIYKNYKFGFAMENIKEDGYISEKIMNVYRGGAIPIYWGTSKVNEIFNPKSFINVDNFTSFEECAKYIVEISKDTNRLKEMQTAPIFLENKNPDYSKYYNTPSPQYVVDIANKLKDIIYKKGGNIKEKTKAYVINLDKRQDRWKQIQEKFKDLPFELERFSAINTANNSTSDDGSKGCVLSHLAVIENAKKNKLPYVLILEDDCKPLDNIKDSWPLIKQWLETNLDKWDTFVGGNTYYGMHSNEKDTIKPICKLNDNLKLYFGKSYTAHFYCVNANVYDKMLELKTHLENNNYSNISTVMNDTWPTIKNMNIVTCAPFMAIQEKGFADRGSLERNYDELFNKSESVFLSVENNNNCNIIHGGNVLKESKAYVINLKKRSDRWEEIQKKFNSSSIELERIDAIEDSDGHLGCGLSFLKVIKIAKDNNLKSVLIFEDDNTPLENFDNRWKIAKKWLDDNTDKWEIFNGGARFPHWDQYTNNTKNSEFSADTKIVVKLDENVNLFSSNRIISNNWIYINNANNQTYDKILNWDKKAKTYIDQYFGSSEYFKTLFIIPILALQGDTYSNTQNSKTDYKSKNQKIIEIFDNILKRETGKQNGGKKKRKTIKKKKGNKRTRKQKGGKKNKIIVRFTGGLANRIFQLFAAYGFAEKWNMDVYIINNGSKWNHVPEEESIKDIQTLFPNIKIFDNSTNISKLKIMNESNIETPESDIILDGYFQNPKYFPLTPIKLNLIEPQNNILKNTNINHLYFIHYRLGDYNNLTNFKLDLNNYYKFCINKILEKDNLSEFLIVSNNINEAKQIINNNLSDILKDKNIIYDDNISRLNSIYYMSKCIGGVCANSSFSWIGAYSIENKNKDLIFMPYPWHNDNSRSKSDIYPEWATIVDINKI